MTHEIRVHREGYHRKGGKYVHPTNYMEEDRGMPGHGHPFLKPEYVKSGILGNHIFEEPVARQHAMIDRALAKFGEKSVLGQLNYVHNVDKITNPRVAHEAERLRKYAVKESHRR